MAHTILPEKENVAEAQSIVVGVHFAVSRTSNLPCDIKIHL